MTSVRRPGSSWNANAEKVLGGATTELAASRPSSRPSRSMAQVTVAALPSGPPAEMGLVPMVWASPVHAEKAQAAAV